MPWWAHLIEIRVLAEWLEPFFVLGGLRLFQNLIDILIFGRIAEIIKKGLDSANILLGTMLKLSLIIKPLWFMSCKILLACFILCSCSTPRIMVETDLYFGQTRPDGSMITEIEWQNFRDNQIAKVFKEGCTVIKASGNWLDPESHKLITEPSYVVIHNYKRSSQKSQQIDSLRYWYKNMFQQQSVLRVDKRAKATF